MSTKLEEYSFLKKQLDQLITDGCTRETIRSKGILVKLAANPNCIRLLESVFDKYGLTSVDMQHNDYILFRTAADNDCVNIMKMLVERFPEFLTENRTAAVKSFMSCCNREHVESVRWLVDTFELTIQEIRTNNDYALRQAGSHVDIPMLRLLLKYYP